MKKIFTFSFLLFVFTFVMAQTPPAPNMNVVNGNFEDLADMAKNANGKWAIKGFYVEPLAAANFIESGSGLAPAIGVANTQAFKVQVENNSTDNGAVQTMTLVTEPINISNRNPGRYYLKMKVKVATALLAKRPFQFLVVATDANGNDVTTSTCIDVSAERTALNSVNDFSSTTKIADYQAMYSVFDVAANTSGNGGNVKFITFKLSFGKNCPATGSTFGTTFYFDDFTLAGPAESTTAISELNSSSSIHVYPNPAKDYVMVKSNDGINEIAVYSISGAVQKKVLVNSNDYKLDISLLPNGIYFVAVKNSKGVINQKISKL
jgi:hypothetical protein